MTSIRGRLFMILMITTGIVWMSAIAWIYLSTRAEVERVLDARLIEAARMVSSLITSQEIDPKRAAQIPAIEPTMHASYDRQLSCQIWALDGTLVGRSDAAPATPLSDAQDGFFPRPLLGVKPGASMRSSTPISACACSSGTICVCAIGWWLTLSGAWRCRHC